MGNLIVERTFKILTGPREKSCSSVFYPVSADDTVFWTITMAGDEKHIIVLIKRAAVEREGYCRALLTRGTTPWIVKPPFKAACSRTPP